MDEPKLAQWKYKYKHVWKGRRGVTRDIDNVYLIQFEILGNADIFRDVDR